MLENQSENDKGVFVSNLHSCAKEEVLFELFLQAGPVRKVVIPRDREGQQRSFGFVYYKHAEAVPYAIELLDGIWLYGRPIRLQYTHGNSHQDCETASPNLQNGLVGNSRLPLQDEHSWIDGMSGMPSGHFPPAVPLTQSLSWPVVSTPISAAPQWLWLESGYASWHPGTDELSSACNMCRQRWMQSTVQKMESIANAEEAMREDANARGDKKSKYMH